MNCGQIQKDKVMKLRKNMELLKLLTLFMLTMGIS